MFSGRSLLIWPDWPWLTMVLAGFSEIASEISAFDPGGRFLRARMMSLTSIPTAVSSRRHHGLCSTVSWRIAQIRESPHTKSLADLMQDVWILCMNFVTSPCHDVSPKGKDSSVGESPPTLRWPYFKESGCWSNITVDPEDTALLGVTDFFWAWDFL